MNKTELIDAMAESANLNKIQAKKALDSMLDTVMQAVKKGDTVALIGFGSFSIRENSERNGRNPQTGDPIKIAASKTPVFKAGKAFKEAVNPPKKSKSRTKKRS